MKTEEYATEYCTERGLSKSTYFAVRRTLNHYSNFQQMSIEELLNEADAEEEAGIRWKKRKLKTRLINYMNHLRTTMSFNTAKAYLKIIKSFYSHYEIEIHKLPSLNERTSNISEPISYADLPTNTIIKKAYNIAKPVMKAILLFQSSTGMSRSDTLNLTIQDFINSVEEYLPSSKDLQSTFQHLQSIADSVDIIPTWRCRRQKTRKYFVTFNSHESTMEIVNYLQMRHRKKELKLSDRLFKINPSHYSENFQELNDALGLKKKGSYNLLRSHMLRKFHASALSKDGMDRYLINVLQGKSNGQVDDVYFFEDETKLRKEYIKHMHSLLILSEVKEVTVYSEEFIEIKKENDKLKEQIAEIRKMQDDIVELKKLFSMK